MCWEVLGIAFCGHPNPPALTFTCGKLHIVARARLLCDKAKGSCVCFFGTCGRIEKTDSGAGTDLTAIPKIRCASCSVREDAVGDRRHGRELIESPLLTRSPVAPYEYPEYIKTLRSLWGNKDACPYHQPKEAAAPNQAPENEKANGSIDAKSANSTNDNPQADNAQTAAAQSVRQLGSQTPPTGPNRPASTCSSNVRKPLSPVSFGSNKENKSHRSITPEKQPIKPNIGIESSRWAPDGSARRESRPSPPRVPLRAPRAMAPVPTMPKTEIPQISAMKDFLKGL